MDSIADRRNSQRAAERVTFGVKALYGLSTESIALPLNDSETIDSGQVCITIDPESDQFGNIGVIDYAQDKLKVRYSVQAVFPGLFDLITSGRYDPSLLAPVRLTATDDCTLTPDHSGWHALGCLDFLPGSLWAGASGG
jgi:hypothetical protein